MFGNLTWMFSFKTCLQSGGKKYVQYLNTFFTVCFFNIVAPEGGVIKFLIIKWGAGITKIFSEVLSSEIHDPPIPKKMMPP